MLNAETGKDFQLTVVHGDRNVHDNLAIRIAQHLPKSLIQVEFVGGEIKTCGLRFPGIDFLFEGNGLSGHDGLR